jgi:hypothetical protein
MVPIFIKRKFLSNTQMSVPYYHTDDIVAPFFYQLTIFPLESRSLGKNEKLICLQVGQKMAGTPISCVTQAGRPDEFVKKSPKM